MIIIFFSHDNKGPGERLLGDIRTKIRGHRIEVEQTLEALSERFHYPMIDRTIVVLVAENRERLEKLISMKDLMSDVPILLILPDRKRSTISTGHRLYPRFVTYVDSDFSDLVSVLGKLIHHAFQNSLPQPIINADLQKRATRRWKQIMDMRSDGENSDLVK